MMVQNIYDDQKFFDSYAQLNRSVKGLDGAPEWSSLSHLLPCLKGCNVIDLGCGYGWFCRYACEKLGASQVLGLDISKKMIERAVEMTNNDKITYQQQDLEELQLSKGSYYLAYSSLTLHYIDNLPKLFDTVYQSLIAGGQFIFTAEHPIYTAPKHPDWVFDKAKQKSWPVNNYQKEGQRITNWLANRVIKQHRMLSTYINLLVKKGFVITYLEEWGSTKPQIENNPDLAEERERPMIFLLTAKK